MFMEVEDTIYAVQSPFFIQSIFTFFQSVLPRYFAEGCLSCSFGFMVDGAKHLDLYEVFCDLLKLKELQQIFLIY